MAGQDFHHWGRDVAAGIEIEQGAQLAVPGARGGGDHLQVQQRRHQPVLRAGLGEGGAGLPALPRIPVYLVTAATLRPTARRLEAALMAQMQAWAQP